MDNKKKLSMSSLDRVISTHLFEINRYSEFARLERCDLNTSVANKSQTGVFRHLDNFVSFAARISFAIWPSGMCRGTSQRQILIRHRGRILQRLFGVPLVLKPNGYSKDWRNGIAHADPGSIDYRLGRLETLADRDLRDFFTHIDERHEQAYISGDFRSAPLRAPEYILTPSYGYSSFSRGHIGFSEDRLSLVAYGKTFDVDAIDRAISLARSRAQELMDRSGDEVFSAIALEMETHASNTLGN